MVKEARPGGDHPVSQVVARSRDTLDGLAEARLWSLSDAELTETLAEAGRLRAQVEELELRLAREADRRDTGARTGATSTPVAWAVETRQTRPVAVGRMRLAQALDRHEAVRVALAGGHLHPDQARVIVDALDALPDDLDADLKARAEQHLLIEATGHDARALRLLTKRLLAVLAPEIGEAADARALEREEREAAAKAFLTMCPDGRGSMVGKFSVPEAQGEMLHKYLVALSTPKHTNAVGGAGAYERRPSPERLGAALVSLIERFPADRLPQLGGLNATAVVTMTLDTARGGDAHGMLDTGALMSGAQSRRFACEAEIITAVLDTEGQVLHLGRSSRLASPAQRRALNLRQPECNALGCDWPAWMCEAHHWRRSWASGGETNLEDLMNLCPSHHRRAHDPVYEMRHEPDGQVAFHRRT
ncbi:DUF222 domain-containing protein [Nocardioides sp. SYSU DS0663]|uniref:HNH endonuclease signature motif containing protein n=1 Tax=Nocardioides sp. SYSU DS0663 TaxID=3416445 RepID=UPI003F4C59C8